VLFTIIVCTYNRADILKITLPCYTSLIKPSAVKLELIIVDNNSNDETKTIAKGFTTKNKDDFANLVYVFEPKQGLSHARNTGYKHAKGDYIAYIDDECILPENWLAEAITTIKKQNNPAFLGGPYYGKFLPDRSSIWYKESFRDFYLLQKNVPDGVLKNNYLSGCNFITRRDVFTKIDLFDTNLGMTGNTLNYGEEQDFQRRFISQYPDEVIWYNSKLFVWHLIRDEQMSILHDFKEAVIRGQSSAKEKEFSLLQLMLSPFLLIVVIGRALLSALWALIKSLFSKEHFLTLLHRDYQNRVWRDIGAVWYRFNKLL
jgi:glycosyltransferase involved in cell wall biosynthesis